MILISIDPGKSGAIAIFHAGAGLPEVYDTPVAGGEYLMADMMHLLANACATHCIIEQAQAMPKQGVSSTFQFGMGYGLWLGLLAGLGIPFETVTPAVWKRKMGLTSEKGKSVALAQQRFPHLGKQLLRSKDGRAEALLLGVWYLERRGLPAAPREEGQP